MTLLDTISTRLSGPAEGVRAEAMSAAARPRSHDDLGSRSATFVDPGPRPSFLDKLVKERHRPDGERSLEEVVSAVWTAVETDAPAACLVCGGELRARYGAGARPVAARCGDCGSELS